jgi:hypothetical protein
MPRKQYGVTLSPEDRRHLGTLIRQTGATALQQRRARILLHADTGPAGPHLTDREIAAAVEVEVRTVGRVRQLYAVHGLAAVLTRRRRCDAGPRVLDGATEARLLTLAQSAPPAGADGWTLRLLASEAVRLEIVPAISHESVRTVLKKKTSNRG